MWTSVCVVWAVLSPCPYVPHWTEVLNLFHFLFLCPHSCQTLLIPLTGCAGVYERILQCQLRCLGLCSLAPQLSDVIFFWTQSTVRSCLANVRIGNGRPFPGTEDTATDQKHLGFQHISLCGWARSYNPLTSGNLLRHVRASDNQQLFGQ